MAEQLHARVLGDSGSRVVFCHGLFGQGRNWTQIAKELSADHRVVLADMPDHGRSPWTEAFDYVGAAERVAELLVGEPAALVGHSMGGKIAMIVALLHPELVERLCVVDVAPTAYAAHSDFETFVTAMRAMDLDTLTSRDDADTQLAQDVPDPVVRGFLLQNLRREGDAWAWQLNLSVLGDDLDEIRDWPDAALAGCAPYSEPVLWVGGDRSDYVDDDHAPAMTALFPRVRRVTVKDAGHWVHSEKPGIMVELLERFLAADQSESAD